MDHLSLPVSGDHTDEIRNYPAQGPKYGSSDSPLVNPQNLPSHDAQEVQTYTSTFSEGGQAGVNGDNSHPVAEGNITFANGPDICKTCVAPKAGPPGPQ